MHTLDITQAKELIRFNARIMNTVTFMWGQFGVGKSELMAQLASEDPDDILVDIRLGQYESVDLRGMPDREDVGKTKSGRKVRMTVWDLPATLPFVGNPTFDNVKGIIWLFLDEANAATASVSGSAYQLVNDGCIGEHKLLPNVRIVMAGNREGIDKGVTNKQPLPLSNRVNHFELVVSTKAWIRYQQSRGVLPPIAYALYEFRPGLLNTYDPKVTGVKTIATPRTSEKAWMVWINKAPLSPTVRAAAMAGWIGEGPATEIDSFVKIWDMLKSYLPTIKADPEGCMLPQDAYLKHAGTLWAGMKPSEIPKDGGLGLQCAVVVAISGEMTKANASHLYKFLQRLDPDFTIMAFQYALERDTELFETDTFIDYAKRYKQAFGH